MEQENKNEDQINQDITLSSKRIFIKIFCNDNTLKQNYLKKLSTFYEVINIT